MRQWLKNKKRREASDTVIKVRVDIPAPNQFYALTKSSKKPASDWFHAMWIVRDELEKGTEPKDISVNNLAQVLDCSWPTAQKWRDKLVEIMPRQRVRCEHEPEPKKKGQRQRSRA